MARLLFFFFNEDWLESCAAPHKGMYCRGESASAADLLEVRVLKMDRRVILAATLRASDRLKNTNTRRGGEIIIAILLGFARTPGNDVE